MATPTYTLIEEQVLGSSAASVTFSSIPSTYKDLVLESVQTNNTNSFSVFLRFNGDSGTNYSSTNIYGNGSSTNSTRDSNQTQTTVGLIWTNGMASFTTQIMSYANTNVNKTLLTRRGQDSWGTMAMVNLWRSTSAITSILLYPENSISFASGSTFRLWGVAG